MRRDRQLLFEGEFRPLASRVKHACHPAGVQLEKHAEREGRAVEGYLQAKSRQREDSRRKGFSARRHRASPVHAERYVHALEDERFVVAVEVEGGRQTDAAIQSRVASRGEREKRRAHRGPKEAKQRCESKAIKRAGEAKARERRDGSSDSCVRACRLSSSLSEIGRWESGLNRAG